MYVLVTGLHHAILLQVVLTLASDLAKANGDLRHVAGLLKLLLKEKRVQSARPTEVEAIFRQFRDR